MEPTDYAKRKMRKRGVMMRDVDEALSEAVAGQIQDDGRHCLWGWSERHGKYLRIIISPGTDQLINAFPDTGFTRKYAE